YLATLDKPVTAEMKAAFDGGIQLKDEKKCMPAALSILDTCTAKVVIHEGMYHQIKRMFGCFGAKVLSLHRIAIGSLALEATLAPGDCRPLTADELSKIEEKSS
ncbi:MAG: 16S rRNA pseudouridine(516) synthase, partial [Angelakisella sp.]